jgi:hypothetical protein
MITYLLAFLAGFIVKVVDWMDDDRKLSSHMKLPLAIAYGVVIGYIIGVASFSTLFLAALVAQVLARKIDTVSHGVGFSVAMLSLFYFGFPTLDIGLFVFFLALAFLDEADYIGRLRPLVEYRPFLKVGVLIPAIFLGRWDYFAGIIAFDVGYELFSKVSQMTKQKKTKKIKPEI